MKSIHFSLLMSVTAICLVAQKSSCAFRSASPLPKTDFRRFDQSEQDFIASWDEASESAKIKFGLKIRIKDIKNVILKLKMLVSEHEQELAGLTEAAELFSTDSIIDEEVKNETLHYIENVLEQFRTEEQRKQRKEKQVEDARAKEREWSEQYEQRKGTPVSKSNTPSTPSRPQSLSEQMELIRKFETTRFEQAPESPLSRPQSSALSQSRARSSALSQSRTQVDINPQGQQPRSTVVLSPEVTLENENQDEILMRF